MQEYITELKICRTVTQQIKAEMTYRQCRLRSHCDLNETGPRLDYSSLERMEVIA